VNETAAAGLDRQSTTGPVSLVLRIGMFVGLHIAVLVSVLALL
jgi:hypothetical protein